MKPYRFVLYGHEIITDNSLQASRLDALLFSESIQPIYYYISAVLEL